MARGATRYERNLALGIRSPISDGSARSYYLNSAAPESSSTAPSTTANAFDDRRQADIPKPYLVCILPLGTEAEQPQRIEKLDLLLTVNEPVDFRLYDASRRPGAWDWADPRNASLAVLFSQAARITGHRAVDLPETLRGAIAEKLRIAKARDRLVRPVLEFEPLDRENLDQLFGELLPVGLALGRF